MMHDRLLVFIAVCLIVLCSCSSSRYENHHCKDVGAFHQLISDYCDSTQSGTNFNAETERASPYAGIFYESLGDLRIDVPICIQCGENEDPLKDYGFTMIDLDGDGCDELIVTSCAMETVFYYPDVGSVDGYFIYNLYTVKDGHVIKLYGLWDSCQAFITADKHILIEGFGGGFDSEHFFAEYEIKEGDFHFIREVRAVSGLYDGKYNDSSQFLMFNSLEEKQVVNNWCSVEQENGIGYRGLGVDRFVITGEQFATYIAENRPIELEVTSFESFIGN